MSLQLSTSIQISAGVLKPKGKTMKLLIELALMMAYVIKATLAAIALAGVAAVGMLGVVWMHESLGETLTTVLLLLCSALLLWAVGILRAD